LEYRLIHPGTDHLDRASFDDIVHHAPKLSPSVLVACCGGVKWQAGEVANLVMEKFLFGAIRRVGEEAW
jgi:hypothetical protein